MNILDQVKAGVYFLGLIYSYLATLLFVALGWIKPEKFNFSKLTVPIFISLINWTFMFFLGEIIFLLGAAVTIFTFGIGAIFILVGIGWAYVNLPKKLLPDDWIAVSDIGYWEMFIMGTVYTLIIFFNCARY